ncbi:hypothetical protein Sros01_04600 [Streptomyces roseochromogenus]|nr:hypothetical protein Sros01_04600 [Streptomyces roseochromogenus]
MQDAVTPFQRVLRSTLADLAQNGAAHSVAPPAVFVIGPTAGLEVSQGRTSEASQVLAS